jgi:hypothetical protein
MDVYMKDSDEQYTPKWIFDALGVEFNLDVCAPQGGVNYIPAKRHYSLADDSLNQTWDGFVWMNPPFSEGKIWHNKFIEHGNGICLAPMSKSYWFYDVWNRQDLSILMPTPRFKFVKPNGKANSIFMPVILYAIGLQGRQALVRSELGKVR